MDAATIDNDFAFVKIAILRGLMTQEQAREAISKLGEAAGGGQGEPTTTLAQILVDNKWVSPPELSSIRRMIEQGHVPVDIPGYVLLSELGHGGMGVVYKARQTSLDRLVAIKVLFPEHSLNPEYITRLQQEARAVAKLQHPNVISAVDFGETGGVHFFIMEFVEGKTLSAIMRERGPLPEKELLPLIIQVGQALGHAHKHQMVHRDVKPANIIVTPDKVAKLADLGLAKSSDKKQDLSLTQDGMFVGSPHYVSPEQAAGEKSLDIRCDIWSLGATMYHAACGEVPFPGESPTVVMARRLIATCPSPYEKAPDLSDGFCQVIEKMMTKARDDRYPEPAAMIADLEAVLAGKPPLPPRVPVGKSSVDRPKNLKKSSRPGLPSVPAPQGRSPGTVPTVLSPARTRTPAPFPSVKPPGAAPGAALPAAGARSAPAAAGTATAPAAVSASAARRPGARMAPRSSSSGAVVGLVVAVLLLAGAGFLYKQGVLGSNPPAPTPDSPPGPGTPPNPDPAANPNKPAPGGGTGTSAAQDGDAEQAFNYVTEFAKAHPQDFDEIVAKFAQVVERHKGTVWGFKAEEQVAKAKAAKEEAQKKLLADLAREVDGLAGEDRFGDALARLAAVAASPAGGDPVLKERLAARTREIEEQARTRVTAAIEDAQAHARQRDFAAARSVLDRLAAGIGVPDLAERVKGAVAEVGAAEQAEKERQAAEARRAAQERFFALSKPADDLAQAWRFGEAAALLERVLGESAGKEVGPRLQERLDDLRLLASLKGALIKAIPARKDKLPTAKFLAKDIGGKLAGATDVDLQIELGRGASVSLPWKNLAFEEAQRLVAELLDRSAAATAVGLGVLALDAGKIDLARAELERAGGAGQPYLERLAAREAEMAEAAAQRSLGDAQAALERKDPDAALKVLAGLKTAFPAGLRGAAAERAASLAAAARAQKAAVLVEQARALAQQKKWAEADALLDTVLRDYADTVGAPAAREVRKLVEANTALRLCDFEADGATPMPWTAAGARIEIENAAEHVKEGRAAGKITYPESSGGGMPCIRNRRVPRDWTPYTAISFWIYSESRTLDSLGLRCFVNGETDKFSYDFTVDWQGWKQVRIKLTDFQKVGAASWDRIEEIALPHVSGKPGVYFVDDFRLER